MEEIRAALVQSLDPVAAVLDPAELPDAVDEVAGELADLRQHRVGVKSIYSEAAGTKPRTCTAHASRAPALETKPTKPFASRVQGCIQEGVCGCGSASANV